MKLGNLKIKAMAALATMILSTAASQAAFTYVTGDVLLGIRSADPNAPAVDYVVDLGLDKNFAQATGPITFTLSGLSTQLGNNFGAGFATDPNVKFALFGSTNTLAANQNGDPTRTNYLTAPVGGIAPLTQFDQSGVSSQIASSATYYKTRASASGVSNSSTGVPTDTNSFGNKVQLGFSNANYIPIEATFSQGLELYKLAQGTESGPAIDQGTFTYTGGNTFTFTPTAVPEPSTAALGGLVVLGLAFRRHRKSVLA